MNEAQDVIAFHRRYTDGLRALGTTPFVVDHEGKLQSGETARRRDLQAVPSSHGLLAACFSSSLRSMTSRPLRLYPR